MKHLLLFITLFWATVSWSSEPSFAFDPDGYDQSTGLLIVQVTATSEKEGVISSYEHQVTKNLFIYDPSTKKGRKLFDKYYGQITAYILESALTKDGEIEYLGASSGLARNNQQIRTRPMRSSILIETFNSTTKQYTVWKAGKLIGTPMVIFSYKKPSSWHIDSKAGIVRLITQDHESVEVKEYAW